MKIFREIYQACTTQNKGEKDDLLEQARVISARSMMAMTFSTFLAGGSLIKMALTPSTEAIVWGALGIAGMLCSREVLRLSDNASVLLDTSVNFPKLLTAQAIAKKLTNDTLIANRLLEKQIARLMTPEKSS
jgi:hypothetical protein